MRNGKVLFVLDLQFYFQHVLMVKVLVDEVEASKVVREVVDHLVVRKEQEHLVDLRVIIV